MMSEGESSCKTRPTPGCVEVPQPEPEPGRVKRISIKVWFLVTMHPERKLVLLFVFCCMVRPSKQSDGAVLGLPKALKLI